MITEVNDALCKLLARHMPAGTEVSLDPPNPTWHSGNSADAIDLFLFELRNDLGGRESGWTEVRDQRGGVLARQQPLRRCRLSYLVTARAPEVTREHALLDQALRTVIFTDTLPADCLSPWLADAGHPVQVSVAEASPAALWSSLGMPARASFVLTVSAAMVAAPDTDLAAPAEQLTLNTGQTVPPPTPLAPAGQQDGQKRWRRTPVVEPDTVTESSA